MIAPQVRSARYWPDIVWRGFRCSRTSRRPRRTVQIRQSGQVAPISRLDRLRLGYDVLPHFFGGGNFLNISSTDLSILSATFWGLSLSVSVAVPRQSIF